MNLLKKNSGLFITFEGIDGSGKSTQINLLEENLIKRKQKVLSTREPGGTFLGEQIRDLLKNNDAAACISSKAELLLFLASRAQLVTELISPSIKQGTTVLCDRFTDSTLLYQGLSDLSSLKIIEKLNHFVCEGLKPDITFLMDLPVEYSLDRMRSRNSQPDRIESKNQDFFEVIRQGYLDLSQKYSDRFVVLDATQKPETLSEIIFNVILQRFT